ncbi:MAG: DNA-binding protein [Coriobacteriia bacterium]|nr:DNA-binding protein [Coriobacteriia bacterium]
MKTTREAAELLGVSPRRVVALIQSGQIEAEKLGKIWLIDDVSLDQFAALPKRLAGRPRKGSKSYETEYVLMNRTHCVVELVYDDTLKEFTSVGTMLNAGRAPLGLMNERGQISTAAYNSWWKNRGIPEGRGALAPRLALESQMLPSELAVLSLGLSLSDQYWIYPKGSTLCWEELNFFDNSFENIPVSQSGEELLRNPDNTSEGALPKHWIIKDGKRRLLKGGGAFLQEPFNEVVATALHQRLVTPQSFVPYQLDVFEDIAVSSCPVFLDNNEEYIAAHYVMRTRKQARHHSDYQHYLESCYALGVEGVELQLAAMIVCDDILANTDRHLRNFGIIRNVDTLHCRPAPLFDSGTSLWCKKPLAELRMRNYSFASKPFRPEPAKQLSLVTDLSWINTSKLDGFCAEALAVLAKNDLLEERLPYIEEGLQRQIDRITTICKYL